MPRRGGTYVDNASNRSLGRVGMAYGTCVQSSSSASRASSSSYGSSYGASNASYSSGAKTYVDNSANRSLGRVGKEVGTHVVHKDGSMTVSPSSSTYSTMSSSRTYVDNPQNRSLGRVGEPLGSHVQYKHGATASSSSTSSAVYADNPTNRKLQRVGKPKGSHVVHRDGSVSVSSAISTSAQPAERYYKDNYFNRKHDRVGKEIVRSSRSPKTNLCKVERDLLQDSNLEDIADILQHIDLNDCYRPVIESIQYELQRGEVEENWEKSGKLPCTNYSKVSQFIREIIPMVDLHLKKQIGKGGFGEVYAAEWKNTPVAFKKLIVQQITNKKKKQLVNEIRIFSKLSHPNIVQMFGVVTEENNIGIVMEYLPKTLFHAIFIEEVEFNRKSKKQLINEVTSAIAYLHCQDIAHCDIKCQNILLTAQNVAKLADFGLSIIKNSGTSTSTLSAAPGQGTPRYSAPEVLRGELLELPGLKKADIYSLCLVTYQVLVEEEPFENLNLHQLVENVGRGDLRPNLKEANMAEVVKRLLERGWIKKAADRPDINRFLKEWSDIDKVFELV